MFELFVRTLPDGRVVHVYPLTFDRARLGVGTDPERYGYDNEW